MITDGIKCPPAQDWILTYTGKKFYPLDPRIEDIDIRDIAHHLAAVNRFVGATKKPYSVAQHSYCVSVLAKEHPLQGLLHDGSEAYLQDIPTPLKRHPVFAGYRNYEWNLQNMIYKKFGSAQGPMCEDVKNADHYMCVVEGLSFMPQVEGAYWTEYEDIDFRLHKHPWSAERAELEFIDRFELLTNRVIF